MGTEPPWAVLPRGPGSAPESEGGPGPPIFTVLSLCRITFREGGYRCGPRHKTEGVLGPRYMKSVQEGTVHYSVLVKSDIFTKLTNRRRRCTWAWRHGTHPSGWHLHNPQNLIKQRRSRCCPCLKHFYLHAVGERRLQTFWGQSECWTQKQTSGAWCILSVFAVVIHWTRQSWALEDLLCTSIYPGPWRWSELL